MMCCVANTSCIELKVDISITDLTLHEELDTAILVHVVTVSRRERTKIFAYDDIVDIESLCIIAEIGTDEGAMREVLGPVKSIDIDRSPLLT